MEKYRTDWLPHLNYIPSEAKMNRTSLYSIALEGWRRGLELKFYNKRVDENQSQFLYSLKSDKRIHFFNESSGDKNTEKAFSVCSDKGLTYNYLEQNNVPAPKGRSFSHENTIEEIITFSEKLTYPLVAKPTNGKSGRGVVTNIHNGNSLRDAIILIREKLKYKNLIVQEHIKGNEVRIYVLDDRVIAAAKRIPANVNGDGKSTISKLIEEKNELRKQVPHLYFRPIVINMELRQLIDRYGYSLDSIPKKNVKVFLREISNISTGGEPVDVTENLSDKQKEIAIQAVNSIPGLYHCGVDMIVDDENNSGTILELNTRPGIGSHLFPVEGKAIDIPKKLIDFYFPEVKRNNKVVKSNLYFNIKTAFNTINNCYSSGIKMQPHPINVMHCKSVLIKTKLDLLQCYSSIENLIIKDNINGYIERKSGGLIELVLAHESSDIIVRVVEYLGNRKNQLLIDKLLVESCDKPITMGFELRDGLNQKSMFELENQFHQNEKRLMSLNRGISRLNKRNELIEKSMSWKITKPLRMFKEILRKD